MIKNNISVRVVPSFLQYSSSSSEDNEACKVVAGVTVWLVRRRAWDENIVNALREKEIRYGHYTHEILLLLAIEQQAGNVRAFVY